MQKLTAHIIHKILIISLLAIPLMLIGQEKTDSLLLKTNYNKARVLLEKKQPDSTLYFAKEGLILAEKYNDRIAQSDFLYLMGKANYQQQNIPSTLRYYLQTLKLKESFETNGKLSYLHFELAELYEQWSVHSKAFQHYQHVLDQHDPLEQAVKISALTGMAKNKKLEGDLAAALLYYEQLIPIYEQKNDLSGKINTLRAIIALHKELGAFETAIQENEKVLSLTKNLKDTTQIIIALNNLGVLYRQSNNYEKALNNFIKSVDLARIFQPLKKGNPTTLSNIGILYQNQQNFPQSLRYLFDAERVIRQSQPLNASSLSSTLNLIAIVYLSKNELNNAQIYNQQAIDIARTIGDKNLEQMAYKTRSSIYEQFHDYEQALAFFRNHAYIKDSLQQVDQITKEKNLLKQFSAEQAEKEMSLLVIDREVEDLKFQQDQLENERLRQAQALQQSLLIQERLEKEQTEQALKIVQQALEQEKANQQLIQTQQQLQAEQKDRQIAFLEKEQTEQQLKITQQQLEAGEKNKELAQKAKEQVELQLQVNKKDFELANQRQVFLRNFVIGILFLSLIILGLLWRVFRIRNKANKILGKRKQEVESALSNLQHTQAQLLQSEKMASLGQLTAGIAHEINNPVNFVNGNASALRRDFEELKPMLQNVLLLNQEEKTEEALQAIINIHEEIDTNFLIIEIQRLLEGINRGSTRLKEIVKGMRTFSANTGDKFIAANLHEGIDSTLTILQNKMKNSVTVHKDYGKIPLVICQFGKINQVFLNIIANAIEAIHAKSEPKPKGDIYITTSQQAQNIHISIKDTGIGMDKETLKKIYEPFFTTKEVGKGVGLGMSISYGIIESHGGTIKIESEPGIGTEFTIIIPIEEIKGN